MGILRRIFSPVRPSTEPPAQPTAMTVFRRTLPRAGVCNKEHNGQRADNEMSSPATTPTSCLSCVSACLRVFSVLGWTCRKPNRVTRLAACLLVAVLLLLFCMAVGRDARLNVPSSSVNTRGACVGTGDVDRVSPLVVRPHQRRLLSVPRTRPLTPDVDDKVNLSFCLHFLRANGIDATFESSFLPAGHSILSLLCDDEQGANYYFGRAPIFRTRHGVRFATGSPRFQRFEPSLEAHRDQCLCTFAELGLPLSFPLTIQGETLGVHSLLHDSIANFHLKQDELAWTAVAYALYLSPSCTWTNRFGETFSFDQLAEELMSRPVASSSCGGTHLVHAVTMILRANDIYPILNDTVRVGTERWISTCTDAAVQSQTSDGYWTLDWCASIPRQRNVGPGWTAPDTPGTQLLVTGHLAEWLLYLPQRFSVPDHVLRRAGGWLLHRLSELSSGDRLRSHCAVTHAIIAVRHLTGDLGDAD
jgi:hypothetical protein